MICALCFCTTTLTNLFHVVWLCTTVLPLSRLFDSYEYHTRIDKIWLVIRCYFEKKKQSLTQFAAMRDGNVIIYQRFCLTQ